MANGKLSMLPMSSRSKNTKSTLIGGGVAAKIRANSSSTATPEPPSFAPGVGRCCLLESDSWSDIGRVSQ